MKSCLDMTDKFYKLRHIPSGLFFTPAGYTCKNLTERGKIYQNKPNIGYLGKTVYTGNIICSGKPIFKLPF